MSKEYPTEGVSMSAHEALQAHTAWLDKCIEEATSDMDRASWRLIRAVMPAWMEWMRSNKVNGEIAMTALANLYGKLGAEVAFNCTQKVDEAPASAEDKAKLREALMRVACKTLANGAKQCLEAEIDAILHDPEVSSSRMNVRLKDS